MALLSAVPDADPRVRKKRLVLTGDVPSPAAPPSGCRFHTRCWLFEALGRPEDCTTIDPEFRDIGDGHLVACHHTEEVPTAVVADAVPTVEATDYDAVPILAADATSPGPEDAGPPAGAPTTIGA